MKPQVLVADDDFDNRTIVQETLEAAGYDVVLAINGEEALEKVQEIKPRVLLLDLSMPKLNGWEVAKRIREIPGLAGTAIIAFTAHALVGDELKAKASGCDDYLSKPCLPRDVLAKVRSWMSRKQTEGSPEVKP
jgi:two-component system, cell cycle response regulator DivK